MRAIPPAECTGRLVRGNGEANPDRLSQGFFLSRGLWDMLCLRQVFRAMMQLLTAWDSLKEEEPVVAIEPPKAA